MGHAHPCRREPQPATAPETSTARCGPTPAAPGARRRRLSRPPVAAAVPREDSSDPSGTRQRLPPGSANSGRGPTFRREPSPDELRSAAPGRLPPRPPPADKTFPGRQPPAADHIPGRLRAPRRGPATSLRSPPLRPAIRPACRGPHPPRETADLAGGNPSSCTPWPAASPLASGGAAPEVGPGSHNELAHNELAQNGLAQNELAHDGPAGPPG